MPVYKFDLPGENGDLYLTYKIKDSGKLKIKEQKIKWSGRNKLEDADVDGEGHIDNGNGHFKITVQFAGGKAHATYQGVVNSDGIGEGNATSSWQGNFKFKILKTAKGTKLQDLLK